MLNDMKSHYFEHALLPDGWRQRVRVVTQAGVIESVESGIELHTEDECYDVVVPAMPNAHSHVFQRAMAGLSEFKTNKQDSFWSWRTLMYRLANEIDREQIYEIARSCYQQMLDAGYASVCEFHYVHRDLELSTDTMSMSKAVMQAAYDVGLPLTMLPVLYAYGSIGEQPLNDQQRRFGLTVEEYVSLWQQLDSVKYREQCVGICFHSLRAVNYEMMVQVLKRLPNDVPVHIHIAEQQAEIDQSLKFYGQRPVAWLYDQFDIDDRWVLVHATHLVEEEIKMISQSQAVVVLCPLTEANLGDGIFPMEKFMSQRGQWAIGSDSHIQICPAEELKTLEYSQRLSRQQRNICCDESQPHVGTWMWLQAVLGGAQASGLPVSGMLPGQKLSFITLNSDSSVIEFDRPEQCLDGYVFSDCVKSQSIQIK